MSGPPGDKPFGRAALLTVRNMKVLIGKKLGMMQHFAEDGSASGVTAIEVWPATVVRLRKMDKDGYEAMQLGAASPKRATKKSAKKDDTAPSRRAGKTGKAVLGQTKGKAYDFLGEFPLADDEVKAGSKLGIDQFEAGERLHATAVSKGKGFQGTIKRHNFSRGPMTHGSRNQRKPGSIGGTDAARVFPGQKMPGRMGAERVSTKNLKVAGIHAEDNVILIEGSVPGPTGSVVTLRTSR